MAGPRAPKAPEEPEVAAAAAVTVRSVSAPLIAANSNTGRVPAPRPPQLKETQRLGYLLRGRKQSCRTGSIVSASTFARPRSLRFAQLKTSVHRQSSSLSI